MFVTPVASRPLRSTLSIVALLILTAYASGCSKNNGTAPMGNTGGPAIDFTFPATGTSLANPGTSHQFQFTTEGTWAYHCIPHASSGMTGTVVVSAAAPADSAVVQVGAGDALAFSPSSVTIKPNGFVRWVNVSSMTIHTVTRP